MALTERPDENWIQTFSGRQFWPLKPQVDHIDITDIAHSLSLQCRFNGHCLRFYSVAEHSVRVSEILPADLALWGLLHDAGEAYLSDLPRPIKRQIPDFGKIEEVILEVVAQRFELEWPMPSGVVQADDRLLATEARDLMTAPPKNWNLDQEPLPDPISPWTADQAEELFLRHFERLTNLSQ